MWSEMKQQQQQQRLKPATWSSLLRSSKEIVRQQQSLIADQGLKIRSIIARYRIIPIYVVYYVVYGASKAIFGKLAKIRLSSLLLPPNFIPHNISSRFFTNSHPRSLYPILHHSCDRFRCGDFNDTHEIFYWREYKRRKPFI